MRPDKLFGYAETLGKGPQNIAEAARIYREALAGIPADVLMAAVNSVIRSHTFNTLPAAGEIVKAAEPEMTKRRKWLYLAKAPTKST